MTEPVKPISSKTSSQQKPVKTENKDVKIGGVSFKKDQIESQSTRLENGKKINTVFVKPGVQIDFPDQPLENHASVNSIGLYPEWYRSDDSHIDINNLNNAKIYGIPNKPDYIDLIGTSSNNEIFVNQKPSFWVNGDMKKDQVTLSSDTRNNTVHMGEDDRTQIVYNQPTVIMSGETVQESIGMLNIEGEGTSEQELQLKAHLGEHKYINHKINQER